VEDFTRFHNRTRDRVEDSRTIFSKWNGSYWFGCHRGDLNFTLGASEVCVLAAHVDFLYGYFIKKLEEVGLLDIEPVK